MKQPTSSYQTCLTNSTLEFQIEELPDDDHWMLLDLPIIQSEAQEQIEVEMVGQTLIEAWKSHGKGVHRLIAHGTSATLALEALKTARNMFRS